jgi:hypothetical protein
MPPSDRPGAVVSVIRLEHDRWIIANVDHPDVVTTGLWLSTAITEHRRTLEQVGVQRISWRYLIGDESTAERIARIRAAGAQIAGLRHRANELEDELRPDRDSLIQDLAELHLAPTEIAQVAAVPPTAIRQDLGSDDEVRLARWLLNQLPGEPPPDG